QSRHPALTSLSSLLTGLWGGPPGSEPIPAFLSPVPISVQVIEAELRSTKRWELTEEGEEIAREGSHEARVFHSIPAEGLAQSELMCLPSGKVGFSKAMSNKWIRVDKSAAEGPRVFRVVDKVEDEVQRRLQLVQGGQAEELGEKERSELRKRKLLNAVTLKTYWVSKGSAFSTRISKQEAELNPEMISR
uniref:phenylalanine--tRNA ligase n=1 Tax=Spermophilus dauricus TaxID=99837 RepID=A0A8C9PNF6_SPEDA